MITYPVTTTPSFTDHTITASQSRKPTMAGYTTTIRPEKPPRPSISPEPTIAKVVLILLLDHSQDWADKYHQNLIFQLKAKGYEVVASSPASAAMSITRYNPSIILIFEANNMDRKCDRNIITERLRNFAHAGGIVIFGGVPWAFNCPDNPKPEFVFNTAFHLYWVVGESLKMEIGDTSGLMQQPRLFLKGTYLNNVPLSASLYRPYTNKIKKGEPCAVALQAYGNGCMGYIGSTDLVSEESKFILLDMCSIAEGMRVNMGGRSPAEVMMGGKVWEPMGWHD